MLFLDGSPHHWFGDDLPETCLLLSSDDATGNAYLGFGTYGLDGGGVLTPSATTHTWKGDDPGAKWDADSFDDATTNLPTGAGRVADFGDGATTTAVSVEAGSGGGPTVGAIRLGGGTAYNLNAGGGTITLDSNDPGDPGTIVAASAAVDHTIGAPIALNSDLNVDTQVAGRGVTISGPVSGAKAVTKKGPGVLTVSGASSYGGGLAVENGQLMLGADVAAAGNSPVGTGALTLAGGTLSASGTRTLSRALVLSADSKLGGTGNGDLTVSGNVSGAYALTMDGDGAATLSGTNSHGETAVSSGTLKLGSAGALGNGNATVDGGQLDIDAAVAADTVTVNNGTMNVNVAASANTLDVKGGVVNLNGVDLNVGTMKVSGGTINAGNSIVVSAELKRDGGTLSIDPGNIFKAGGTITKDGAQKITLYGGTLTATSVPPVPAGAIAYYSFNDSGNPGNDDSGNTHQGALSGGAVYTVSGKLNGGMSTPGGNSVMKVNPVVDIGNDWTFGAWFNTLAPVGAWRTLIRGGGGDHQIIVESSSTRLGIYSNINGAFRPSGYNMGLPAGEWHHIAAVGAGGTYGNIQYYIDGQPVGDPTDRSSSTDIFAIGNYQDGGQRFADTIDEVYVYGAAFTAEQVAALYASAAGGGGGGGGAVVLNDLAGTGTVVGDIQVGGALGPGHSIGTLNVTGDLTMVAGSVYEWGLGAGVNDLIAVDGDLTCQDGWMLKALNDGVGAADGDFLLFTYTGAATVGTCIFHPGSDWDTTGLGIYDDGAGNVYLTGLRVAPIPEPPALSLVGLTLLALRRKKRS